MRILGRDVSGAEVLISSVAEVCFIVTFIDSLDLNILVFVSSESFCLPVEKSSQACAVQAFLYSHAMNFSRVGTGIRLSYKA